MLQKNRIRKLPKDVADKIAAGEVVDRPVSIVKELVENSIDAGATSITVEIRRGGKEYIRVTDDGCGIPKEDLRLAFLRHATSKIVDENDLFNINTLGFRGEALASIAAVSRLEIITKTINVKIGSRLQIEGGNIIGEGDTGCPDGTTVIVTDLFFNTPARKKFMKQDRTESALIIDFVSKIALAYPNIKIRLINNRSTLFSTRGKGNIHENILIIYSKEIGDKLIEVNNQEGDYQIKAYISPLDLNRSNRKSQVFFLNGRQIDSKVLDKAVRDAYKDILPEGRFLIVFIFLTLDPRDLDVNIHPNKKEVKFNDSEKVQSFVVNSIQSALYSKSSLPEIKPKHMYTEKVKEINRDYEQVDIKTLLSNRQQADNIICKTEESKELKLSEINITETIFGTYITGFDEDNFYLIDQHAAHERVFYEKLMELMEHKNSDSQLIISPFVIDFPLAIKAQLPNCIVKLREMGYVLEEFGPRSYIVKAIPSFMNLSEARIFLDDFMDQIGTNVDNRNVDKIIINACKSAVKANDSLTLEEVKELINDLVKTKNPLTCPHGRPTLINLSKYEIEKMFKRV